MRKCEIASRCNLKVGRVVATEVAPATHVGPHRGYAWSKANERIYLYECDSCGGFFVANAKGQGGDLKTHDHGESAGADSSTANGIARRKVASINEIRAALVVLAAAAKLSPLNELTDEDVRNMREEFLANVKSEGGGWKTHGHPGDAGSSTGNKGTRHQVLSLTEIWLALASLAAINKLSALDELTKEVHVTVSGTPNSACVVIAKQSTLPADELEFLARYEFARASADLNAGPSAAESFSAKTLQSVAAAIADVPLQVYSCSACGEQALRAAGKKQQHKCAPARAYMHPVAGASVVSSFLQFPAACQLALLAESAVPGQLV
ncbi:hypothetical protein HDU89_008560 [Geranomyces variabilis]|nr:hypothetical protein HDU89_008560 [Geranomyces variabilis]